MITKKFLSAILSAIIFSASSSTFAEEDKSAEIEQTIKKLDDKDLSTSLEARYFSQGSDANAEFVIRHKNFSGNVSEKNNLHYIKLSLDKEIISLMGTGAFWNFGLAGSFTDEKFSVLPTVGFGIYMAIMPKMTIYTQISGIYLGGLGHLHDFEGGLKYSPSKNFTLTAGFRDVNCNINHGQQGSFRLSRPFIGLRTDF